MRSPTDETTTTAGHGGAERSGATGRGGAGRRTTTGAKALYFGSHEILSSDPRTCGPAHMALRRWASSWPNVAPRTPASRHTVPKTISKPLRYREVESRHTKQMRGDPWGDRKYTPPSPQITNKRQRKGRERLAGTTPTRPPEQHAAAARATPAIDAPQSGASAPRPGP